MDVKEFWKQLCEGFDYRFFSGIPFTEVEELYKNMDSKIMHYVPAVNEHIALSLASGAWTSGFKSAIILPSHLVNKLDLKFNMDFKIPILIITTEKGLSQQNKKRAKKDLAKTVNYIENKCCSGIFLFN